MILEAVRLALRSILRNKLRSFLTMLGIVIGVAAVIAMVTVGQGSSQQVSQSVSSLGSDTLNIRPGQRGFGGPRTPAKPFSLADADAIVALPAVGLVAPTAGVSATVVYGNANAATSVSGTNDNYLDVAGWNLAAGRNMSAAEADGGAPVCLIGETVRRTLFGNADPIGEQIRIKAVSCQVIGLLESKGAGSFGQDQDDMVLMPIRSVQRRLNGNNDVNGFQLSVSPEYTTAQGIQQVQNLLRERRHIGPGAEDDFSVTDMKEIASMLSSVDSVLSGLLSSVAAVSLLVGGIGIMNIMLVSVTERTREIGIRLAVGATSGQVLTQFLIESVVLSLIGGVIGIITGLGLAWIAGSYMEIPFVPSMAITFLAFVFSAFVGVVFGYFPARRAARLDPIEALRYQ